MKTEPPLSYTILLLLLSGLGCALNFASEAKFEIEAKI